MDAEYSASADISARSPGATLLNILINMPALVVLNLPFDD
jgi:hypothetical protein